MLSARCTNYLNKENNDSVKGFSGLVITLRTKCLENFEKMTGF